MAHVDPRNASRTPSAAREPTYRLRYQSPVNACKCRWLIVKCISSRFLFKPNSYKMFATSECLLLKVRRMGNSSSLNRAAKEYLYFEVFKSLKMLFIVLQHHQEMLITQGLGKKMKC